MLATRFVLICAVFALSAASGCTTSPAHRSADPAAQASASPSVTDEPLPQVLSDCEHFSRWPTQIGVACGDGNYQLVEARYDGWTGEQASGHAVAVTNTCRPSCADGTFLRTPVDFRLDSTLVVYGVTVFTRLTVIDPRSGKAVLTTPLLPMACSVSPPSCPPSQTPSS